jgi:hypothetical protein
VLAVVGEGGTGGLLTVLEDAGGKGGLLVLLVVGDGGTGGLLELVDAGGGGDLGGKALTEGLPPLLLH